MTDAQWAAWLLDPNAKRVVLVEATANVSGTETKFYMSTGNYVTRAADTPPSQFYLPVIKTGAQYSESISVSPTTTAGTSSITGGDIALYNPNGELDAWLNYVWINRTVNASLGDESWDGVQTSFTRGDFRLIFTGIVADIHSESFDMLNLIMADKTAQLNVPLTTQLLGGTGPNATSTVPLCFGECFNITPVLYDQPTLTYQVHNGPIELIIEVRDNGVPVAFTPNLAAGTFQLNQSPIGAVTCSVQGDKAAGVYSNTISKLVQRMATGFGLSNLRFSSADLDATNLGNFETAHQQPVGIYITGSDTVLGTIQALAASIGAEMAMSRAGLTQLFQISFPVTGTPTVFDTIKIKEFGLMIADRSIVQGAIALNYAKNWTQQNLTTSLPAADLAIYARASVPIVVTDAATMTLYKVTAVPQPLDTFLLVDTDAQAEANRLLQIFKVPRTTYQFTATGASGALNLVLGQALQIIYPRFGMSSGTMGIVISLAPDWITGEVTVKVLI
jgi:hypothetical protein